MNKIISLITLILFLSFSLNCFAQVNVYTFSQSAASYSEIIGGTVVATATGIVSSTGQSMDDTIYFK